MNWYYKYNCDFFLKIAAKIQDINDLKNWNSSHTQDSESLLDLRNILGNIIKHLNEISYIFKMGIRNPNPEISKRAAELYPDVSNIEELHNVLQSVNTSIHQDFTEVKDPIIPILKNLIHTILNANFNDYGKEQFRIIATGNVGSPTDYSEEVNAERMNQFLQSSIYSTKDGSSRSLRVIREILQNSSDAVMRQKELKPESPVKIDMYTKEYPNNTMDLMVVDSGTGMNWDILSKKFFVYFESGKQQDPNAAGGFGIAKALIQETPEEGWSIDTGGIHSSRFGKNVYMGTPKSQNYQTPKSTVQPNPEGGTILTLYKIPTVDDYAIVDLGKKYATNGVIQISINNNNISPTFLLTDLKKMDSLNVLVDELGTNTFEKEIVRGIVQKEKEDLPSSGELNFTEDGTKTNAKFYINKVGYSGKFYVFLNNQYQYDTDYLSRANVICNITTTARPGTDTYPVDPGRENLREPYKTAINGIKESIKETLRKISENKLLEEGLDIFTFNQNATPMSTSPKDDEDYKGQATRNAIEKAWGSVSGTGMFANEKEKMIAAITQAANSGELSLEPEQKTILQTMVNTIRESDDERFDVKEKLDEIIEGLTTPGIISIQKNFVSHNVAHSRVNLTANIMILWQKVLKLVINKVGGSSISYAKKDAKFVPGLVFSNECLALYMPPKHGLKTHAILLNPITVASIAEPDLFDKILNNNASDKAFSSGETADIRGETPTNKLAAFLFHTAIHELTHLLYPDYYGHEQFHIYISKLETMMHFEFPKIREETKKYMQQIRKDSKKLISAIGKDKKKAGY